MRCSMVKRRMPKGRCNLDGLSRLTVKWAKGKFLSISVIEDGYYEIVDRYPSLSGY